MAPIALFQINFQPHLHGLPAYLSPKALIPRQNIHLYSKKKMGLINMLFIVIALQVLFLMCMPAHEARRILYAENKKCDEKLRGQVVLSSTAKRSLSKCAKSGNNQGYLFFNDQPKGLICHWSQHWCLSFNTLIAARRLVPPSAPNAHTWTPPKRYRAPPSLGSKQKSPSSSVPKGSTSIP